MYDVTMCVGAEWIARADHKLVDERICNLVYDAFQCSKPQCQDNGTGSLHCVAVVGRDGPSLSDLNSELSRRLDVGTREPQSLAAEGELPGDD